MSRVWPIVRNLLIPVLLGVALLSCVVIAFLLINKPVNNQLNPLESLVLRIVLSSRKSALETAPGSDQTPIRFIIDKGDNASTIAGKLLSGGFIRDADL